MASVSEKEMYTYFTQLNEAEKIWNTDAENILT